MSTFADLKTWLFSKSTFPFFLIGLVFALYLWRQASVKTYEYLKEQQDYARSHMAPMVSDDSALEFLSYDSFDGPRKGMVFRYGSKGVGYYEDKGLSPNALQYAVEGGMDRV